MRDKHFQSSERKSRIPVSNTKSKLLKKYTMDYERLKERERTTL